MLLDFNNLNETDREKYLLNAFPRPIAWVTTKYNETINLAPFSFFGAISTEPPLIILSIGNEKDTLYKHINLEIKYRYISDINSKQIIRVGSGYELI